MTGSSSHHINIQELSMIFKRKRWLAAAYLFGSTVTGRKRPGSDLDLAIITKKTISGRERLKMETDLVVGIPYQFLYVNQRYPF